MARRVAKRRPLRRRRPPSPSQTCERQSEWLAEDGVRGTERHNVKRVSWEGDAYGGGAEEQRRERNAAYQMQREGDKGDTAGVLKQNTKGVGGVYNRRSSRAAAPTSFQQTEPKGGYSLHRNSLIAAANAVASLKPWPHPSHLCSRAFGRRAAMRSAFSNGTCVGEGEAASEGRLEAAGSRQVGRGRNPSDRHWPEGGRHLHVIMHAWVSILRFSAASAVMQPAPHSPARRGRRS